MEHCAHGAEAGQASAQRAQHAAARKRGSAGAARCHVLVPAGGAAGVQTTRLAGVSSLPQKYEVTAAYYNGAYGSGYYLVGSASPSKRITT